MRVDALPAVEAIPETTPAVRVRGVRRTYTADLAPVRALRGVDLEIAVGEFIAIMGPSGCGKSTLLNIVAGLERLDDGTVEVAGERIDDKDEDWLAKFRRHHIGIVFQFFNLLDGVSALDNIALPAVLGGMRRKDAMARARELLDLLGLGDRSEQVPAVLSGGQRQRLAIARALVNEPTLLLADEPTGALDTAGGLEVLELFRRLHATGQTIIMVTHSEEVARGADRVVVLRDGQIASESARPVTVVWSWLRLEARRRWRSLVVLALLVGIAGGTVFTALAGARRGASAQQRLLDRTLPATSAILANTPGFDWGPIRNLPEVEALTLFVVDYAFTTVGFSGEGVSFPPADDEFLRTIEKPVIFEGRALDPRRADEVDVSRAFVAHHHKGVGDTLAIILATPKEIERQQGSGPHGEYTGPRVTLHIVGVGETSPAWGADEPGGTGGVALSPGLYAKYPQNIVGPPGVKTLNYVNALVRLRHGEADVPKLSRDVERVTGRSDIDVWNLPAQLRAGQRHIAFESRCLLAFAIAAFLAALFLVGQAIARYAAANAAELRTLRALGMTPRQAIVVAVCAPALTGLAGAAAAVAGAVYASRWMPFGTAGLIEPSPGTAVDWVVLAPGAVAVVVLVTLGALRSRLGDAGRRPA